MAHRLSAVFALWLSFASALANSSGIDDDKDGIGAT
jgi:hypothetical protein